MRLLVVDDDPIVLKVLQRALRKEAYAVDVAMYAVTAFLDGVEALEFYRIHLSDIDLLLTDVVMPKMSGKALSDQATSLNGSLKTLFMSGYTDEVIAQRGVLDADETLLKKPFKAKELLARVRLSLDTRAAA